MGAALSNIVLSIVVPTYNRAQLLKGLLESIVQNYEQWPSDLELIITDNASIDETKSVVSGFVERGFPISYIVNASNIGADGNIAGCFNLASGKYFWVVGDDEIMYRGAVEFVLDVCRNREFGLLHLASKGFKHGQQAISLGEISEKIYVVTLDSRGLLRQANVFLTFISANVVNRKVVMETFPDFDARVELNTHLCQLAWTFNALIATNIHYHVRTPLFGALGGNTGGYKLIEVFGVNLIKITKKYLHNVIPNAERIMLNAVITRLLAGELISLLNDAERCNQFESEDIRDAAKHALGTSFFYWLFIMPILSGSKVAKRVAWFSVRVFNKTNRVLNYRVL